MNFVRLTDRKEYVFEDVNPKKTFWYCNEPYVKLDWGTDWTTDLANALNLYTHNLASIPKDKIVTVTLFVLQDIEAT